ncbi:MAG TPA: hypothetical protein VLZ77_00800 [Acidimicrobiales bacterium]|nr:hypothetical protein [Acidimicrobiales bacterium]
MPVRHAQWDLPEAVAIVVLLALGLLVVAGVVAGVVVGIGGSPGLSGDESAASALSSATGWAVPAYAFVALLATGLLWWEVRTATAVVDGALALDDAHPAHPSGHGDDDEGPVLDAFDHLLRASTLATATVPVLMALVLGALAAVVGSFLSYRGSPAPGGYAWSGHALVLGSGAAVWVIAGAGLVLTLHLRALVGREFARAEHAAARERALGDPTALAGGDGGGA